MQSPKRWVNIPERFTPWWFMQSNWNGYYQRVTKDTGYEIAGVEKLLQENVLPSIFFGKSKYFPSIVVTLSTIAFNKYSLGLQDPVTSDNNKYLSFLHTSSKLIGATTRESVF